MWKSRYSEAGSEKNFTADNGVKMFGLNLDDDGGSSLNLEYNTDTIIALLAVFIIIEILVSKGIKLNCKD